MRDKVKMALRIVTNAYDDEIDGLIAAAFLDLGIAGVAVPEDLDDIVALAVTTFCKLHFGSPEEYDRLKASYDEQKAQLSMATGYTVWTEATSST
jgi:hypothetical protein